MILPTKRITADKALLGLGARVLRQLQHPQTVSRLWEVVGRDNGETVPYDWFVLSLDLLFIVGAVEYEGGRLRRTAKSFSSQTAKAVEYAEDHLMRVKL